MSAGLYIWQGLKPCFKMLFTIACGFALTKKGLFPPAASKGLSQVSMNIGLPCLLFSSIVPSYDSTNIENFGPLFMVAILWQAIGLLMILIVRELFWVPADFQWGILILGSLSNWGNLPTAIIESVGREAPFDPATGVETGIAYTAVFIMVMNMTLFGTGLYHICGWDFDDNVEEVPPTLQGRIARRRRQLNNLLHWLSDKKHGLKKSGRDAHETQGRATATEDSSSKLETLARRAQKAPKPFPGVEKVHNAPTMDMPDIGEPVIAPAKEDTKSIAESVKGVNTNGDIGGSLAKLPSIAPATEERQHDGGPEQTLAQQAEDHPKTTIFAAVFKSVQGFMTPPTLGVLVSLPFALILPLKALMVPVEGWSGTRIRNAPDGSPPLAFFYDFTGFLGAMTIPGSLIILGASFARIKISRSKLRAMPIAAIAASTAAKMAVMPLIGIFITIGLRNNTTLLPKSDKMLSFVPFLLSGTPSAVNQLVVTQIFAKEGRSLDTLATFLLAQYILLLVQSAGVCAISLWLVS